MGCSFQKNITEKISDPEFVAQIFDNEIKLKRQQTIKINKKALILKGKNFYDCYEIITSAGTGIIKHRRLCYLLYCKRKINWYY